MAEMQTPEVLQQAPEENVPQPTSSSPVQIASKDGVAVDERQKQLVVDLVKMFQDYEQWRKPFENMWNEIYRLYFTSVDKTKTSTRSSITVPIIFQVIEAAVPKVINSIFGNGEEFFDVIPTDPKDQQFADAIQLLLTFQLGQADFMIKFIDFVKQLLLYGTSYFYVYWKVKRAWVYKRTPTRVPRTINGYPLPDEIQWTETKTYEVVERRPEIEVLDILDVFPDPEARTEKDARGLFVRSWMDVDEVKEQGKGGIFANTDGEMLQSSSNDFSQSRQTRYSIRGTQTPKTASKNQVELLTYWGCWDLDGDGIREEVQIVIANRQVLLIARANPFHHQKRPVVRCVFFPIPLEWFGMGLVEPVMSNVHELWTLRRQRLDNINLILNRMWLVSSLADVDLDTLISTPNGVIVTDDMQGVDPIETTDVTSSAYNEAAQVQTDIENATAPRSVQGTPESGRLGRTAKGAQLIIAQALEKFAVATKLVEELGIKRVIRLVYDLDLQFIDNDEQMKEEFPFLFEPGMDIVTDPATGMQQQVPTEPPINGIEDIRAKIRFQMVGISDMIGTEGKINQIISWFGVFAPYLDGGTISWTAKRVFKLMGLDPDEVNIMGLANPLAALNGGVNPEQNAIIASATQNGAGSSKPAPGAPSAKK